MSSVGEGPVIVAIDGPGGVGKSTVARRLAERLGVPYLETGAMYRALGLKVLRRGVDPEDEAAVLEVAASLDLDVEILPAGEVSIRLDGAPVGDRIRDEDVARSTSKVAAYSDVRRRMVELQRRVGGQQGGVVEGRDIGTKVFPSTPFKFFLEADPEVRALRRLGEHVGRGEVGGDLGALGAELAERDRRDAERSDSPLRKDASYTVLDTSELTVEEVVERIYKKIREGQAADSA